jgi:hypothetical protein
MPNVRPGFVYSGSYPLPGKAREISAFYYYLLLCDTKNLARGEVELF